MDSLNRLSNQDLMKLKLCELRLSIGSTYLAPIIEKVKKELQSKKLLVTPHFWISDEWFTPDGITGVAVPFYLLHPRLMELEREQMGHVEGESRVEATKIIRHEIGHVIDNAYGLRRNRSRVKVFGKASATYPSGYSYKPYSRSYVRNLADGYAQSHAVEDFAETFAIWLNPRSNWRQTYKGWPALKKLEYVDQLMKTIQGTRPSLISKERYFPLSELEMSLGSYYRKRRRREGLEENTFWNDGVSKYFSTDNFSESASRFLSSNRKLLCSEVSANCKYPKYLVNQMVGDFIKEVRKHRLSKKSVTSTDDLSYYLTKKMKKFVNEGRHIISL